MGLHDDIGSTGHHPKWATAFKFTASIESTLEAVDFQVGRTGVLYSENSACSSAWCCCSKYFLAQSRLYRPLRLTPW